MGISVAILAAVVAAVVEGVEGVEVENSDKPTS